MEDLCQGLVDAVDWCELRIGGDVSARYRSRALRPIRDIGECTDHLDVIAAIVTDVLGRRRTALAAEPGENRRANAGNANGRLLAFFPQMTICDGVGQEETAGFLDGCNVPPWDTWVGLIDDLLISYVPPEMTADVSGAIDCTVDESICWLDNADRTDVSALTAALARM